jgi:hypothetical protein
LVQAEAPGARLGLEDPDDIVPVVRPHLGHDRWVTHELVGDQGDPFVLPGDEDMTVASVCRGVEKRFARGTITTMDATKTYCMVPVSDMVRSCPRVGGRAASMG